MEKPCGRLLSKDTENFRLSIVRSSCTGISFGDVKKDDFSLPNENSVELTQDEKEANDNNQNKSTQTSQPLVIEQSRKSKNHRRHKSSLALKKMKQLDQEEANGNTKNHVSYAQNRTNLIVSNMKTAFMLFVVTLIMAIVYTPALLTSLGYINYNPIHWNIIYLNNAANPLVYSFLNPNFRKSLKKRFKTSANLFLAIV